MLGFLHSCTADLLSSLAYESAEQRPKHCLTPGFLIPNYAPPQLHHLAPDSLHDPDVTLGGGDVKRGGARLGVRRVPEGVGVSPLHRVRQHHPLLHVPRLLQQVIHHFRVFYGYTLCSVHSVPMFCFVFFWLPIGLHSSCSIRPTASGTCQNYYTKCHVRVDAPQCRISIIVHCQVWLVCQIQTSLQGVPCPRRLGFVDFDLGCSTILPCCSAASAKFPPAQAE